VRLVSFVIGHCQALQLTCAALALSALCMAFLSQADMHTGWGMLGIALVVAQTILVFCCFRRFENEVGGSPDYAVDVANRIASGKLSTRIVLRPDDSMSVLHAVASIQHELADVVQRILGSVEQVSRGAQQMSSKANEITFSVQMQSGSTSETVEKVQMIQQSITELSGMVRDTEQRSHRVSQLSAQGEGLVRGTTETMQTMHARFEGLATGIEGLHSRSAEVGSIILVIREIAEQTNMLALNAAIEAARAGESGRGFAVVADEVRKLAERTAQATADISGRIGSIQTETSQAVDTVKAAMPVFDQGIDAAMQAARFLSQITGEAASTLEQIEQITGLANFQVMHASHIAESVNQIAEMLRMTDEAVQEATSIAVGLDQAAATLAEVSSHFDLSEAPEMGELPPPVHH